MNRKLLIVKFCLFLAMLSLVMFNTAVIHGTLSAQTIPTRTPTPPPTNTPSAGGNTPDPTATNTPAGSVGPTATSTLLPVEIAPTPEGGFLPTAEPCSGNPTIETLGATNVRSGPGLEYDVIGELVYLEVRYIVGRAETAEWWLIQFNDGQLGWVANQVVIVQGYTPIVPIVEAPPLNGVTPTPGAPWNPTPPPFCTVTPPPTDTPTAVPTATAEVAESVITATATQPPPTENRPTSTPIVQATAVPPLSTAAAGTPETSPEPKNSNLGLILLGAAAVLGAGLFFYFRQQRS